MTTFLLISNFSRISGRYSRLTTGEIGKRITGKIFEGNLGKNHAKTIGVILIEFIDGDGLLKSLRLLHLLRNQWTIFCEKSSRIFWRNPINSLECFREQTTGEFLKELWNEGTIKEFLKKLWNRPWGITPRSTISRKWKKETLESVLLKKDTSKIRTNIKIRDNDFSEN